MKKKMILLGIVLGGCSTNAEEETRAIARALAKAEDARELEMQAPALRKRFRKLAELMVKAEGVVKPTAASEELFIELARLYEIPGCREIIENSQEDAVKLLR